MPSTRIDSSPHAQDRMQRLGQFLSNRRNAAVVVALTLVFAAVCGVLASRVETDHDVLAFLPADNPDIQAFREINARFGGLEVALVGIDSPVFRSGLVFQEILFDENAACHIAVGSAYKTCLQGGESMSEAELEAVGCNVSSAHTDMMISDEQVDVVARTHAGETVPLLEKGQWRV